MTQGYIIMGVDDYGETQNIACAYALSLSIKMLDPDREVCVVVHKHEDVPLRYEGGFDYIVELPYGRSDSNHHDIRIDFWQLYYASPFEENLYVDTYSIATESIASLWECAQEDILFGRALTFRSERIELFSRKMYDVQQRNSINIFDTGMVFWRKSQVASEFFKMADPVFKSWRDVYREVLTEARPEDFDMTVVVNTVADMLGETYLTSDLFHYRDMGIQFPEPDEDDDFDWIESLNFWVTDDVHIKINNYRQTGIVRYSDPELLTDEIITKIHEHYQKGKVLQAA